MLTANQQQQIERFENAWQSDQTPNLQTFLTDIAETGTNHASLLFELIVIDLEYRWQRAGAAVKAVDDPLPLQPTLDDYVTAGFLDSITNLPTEVIAEEYRIRHLYGDRPGHRELLQRYLQDCPTLSQHLNRVDKSLRIEGDTPANDAAFAKTKYHSPVRNEAVAEQTQTVSSDFRSDSLAAQNDEQRVTLHVSGDASPASTMGRKFGDYELLEEIASGGMGMVYKARHVKLDRIVALKTILSGQLASEEQVRRFEIEAEAAAKLDHPGIVPIFEVGECEGVHFFSMGFVEGKSLAERPAAGPLEMREAAEVVRSVAVAVQYAHARNIVHRDLKPANVLLDEQGQPKVTDFGLAKIVDRDSSLTATGEVMGTPAYMPSEQASGKTDEVGPLADIYSLGAILFFLLTQRPPFKGNSLIETLRLVVEQEADSPQRYNSKVDLDLATICLKCLRKEPERRYTSAAELADDLQRWLDGKPIEARPVGRVERLVKWGRRNPVVAGMGTTLLVMLMATATVSSLGYLRESALRRNLNSALTGEKSATAKAKRQTQIAEVALRNEADAHAETQKRIAETFFERGISQCEGGEVQIGLLLLAQSLVELPREDGGLADVIRRNITCWSEELSSIPTHYFDHALVATSATFMSHGNSVVIGCEDGSIVLWDLLTDQHEVTNMSHSDVVCCVGVSPDQSRIVTGDMNGTVRIWDIESQKQLGNDILHAKNYTIRKRRRVSSIQFTPDSRIVITGALNGTLHYVNAKNGKSAHDPTQIKAWIFDVRITPDGKHFLTSGEGAAVQVRETTGAKPVHRIPTQSVADSAAMSPDGNLIATVCRDNKFRIVNAQTGNAVGPAYEFENWGTRVDFKADGSLALCGSRDSTAQLFESRTALPIGCPLNHRGRVTDLSFAAAGDRFLTLATGQLRIWERYISHTQSMTTLNRPGLEKGTAFFLAEDKQVAVATPSTVAIYDAKTLARSREYSFEKPSQGVAINVDRSHMLLARDNGSIELIETATGKSLSKPLRINASPSQLALHPDEEIFAASTGYSASLWSLKEGKMLADRLIHPNNVNSLEFSPDGKTLATACEDGVVRFWDSRTGSPTVKQIDCQHRLRSILYSPDGRLLCVSGEVTSVWDLKRLERVFGPLKHERTMRTLVLSNDMKFLAIGGGDWVDPDETTTHDLRIWSIAEGRAVSRVFKHPHNLLDAYFSDDDKTLLTSCGDGNVRLWKVPCPVRGKPEEIESRIEYQTSMKLDRRHNPFFLDAPSWHQRRRRSKAFPSTDNNCAESPVD